MTMTLVDDREAVAVSYLEQRLNTNPIPPPEWFEEVPSWYDPQMGLVQVQMSGPDEGRVAALVAPWNECILDGKQGCWTAPPSLTNYEFAHVGSTPTQAGPVRTANIGGKINHADIRWPMEAAVDHYANTATRTMQGRYIDTPDGIMFLGVMAPGSTRLDALTVTASALSGDWRWVETLKGYEMAGSQLVNNPAFRPLPLMGADFAITASLGARVAALGDGAESDDPPAVVFGNWTFTAGLNSDGTERPQELVEIGRDIERLSAVVASLAARAETSEHARFPDDFDDDDLIFDSGPATEITLQMRDTDGDGDIDMDDIDAIAREVFGCERCSGDGCRHCGHTGMKEWKPSDDLGYDIADELPDEDPDWLDHPRAMAIPDEIPLIEG